LALGAFFAGMIVLRKRVFLQPQGGCRIPCRCSDAFSVLFFVSVGMLFDPGNAAHPKTAARCSPSWR
jgi:CPA2 family monovalent cation:H+ antiporter-2